MTAVVYVTISDITTVSSSCMRVSLNSFFVGSAWSDGVASRGSCWLLLSNLTPQVRSEKRKAAQLKRDGTFYLDGHLKKTKSFGDKSSAARMLLSVA